LRNPAGKSSFKPPTRAYESIRYITAKVPTIENGRAIAGIFLPQIRGGGDVIVKAGNDIRGGTFYVGRGRGAIEAGESIVGGGTVPTPDGLGSLQPKTLVALGGAQITVRSRGDLQLEGGINPTLITQASLDPSLPRGARDTSVFSTFTSLDSRPKAE
jgi:hypothetical protein